MKLNSFVKPKICFKSDFGDKKSFVSIRFFLYPRVKINKKQAISDVKCNLMYAFNFEL